MLIDTFINAIFLYDDKMVITFNYKEGTKTITFAELQEAISNKNGSDLDCLAAPTPQILRNLRSFSIFKGMCGLENSDISSSDSEYPKQMIYLCRFRAIIPEDNK